MNRKSIPRFDFRCWNYGEEDSPSVKIVLLPTLDDFLRWAQFNGLPVPNGQCWVFSGHKNHCTAALLCGKDGKLVDREAGIDVGYDAEQEIAVLCALAGRWWSSKTIGNDEQLAKFVIGLHDDMLDGYEGMDTGLEKVATIIGQRTKDGEFVVAH